MKQGMRHNKRGNGYFVVKGMGNSFFFVFFLTISRIPAPPLKILLPLVVLPNERESWWVYVQNAFWVNMGIVANVGVRSRR